MAAHGPAAGIAAASARLTTSAAPEPIRTLAVDQLRRGVADLRRDRATDHPAPGRSDLGKPGDPRIDPDLRTLERPVANAPIALAASKSKSRQVGRRAPWILLHA